MTAPSVMNMGRLRCRRGQVPSPTSLGYGIQVSVTNLDVAIGRQLYLVRRAALLIHFPYDVPQPPLSN